MPGTSVREASVAFVSFVAPFGSLLSAGVRLPKVKMTTRNPAAFSYLPRVIASPLLLTSASEDTMVRGLASGIQHHIDLPSQAQIQSPDTILARTSSTLVPDLNRW